MCCCVVILSDLTKLPTAAIHVFSFSFFFLKQGTITSYISSWSALNDREQHWLLAIFHIIEAEWLLNPKISCKKIEDSGEKVKNAK